jgi:hypothetical protein
MHPGIGGLVHLFDGAKSLEPLIESFEDGPHTAGSDGPLDAIPIMEKVADL